MSSFYALFAVNVYSALGKIVEIDLLTFSDVKMRDNEASVYQSARACIVVTFSLRDARRFSKNQCAARALRKAPMKLIQLRYQPKIVTSASHTVQPRRSQEAGGVVQPTR